MGSKGARAYHGGMSHGDRKAVHHAFVRDEVQVVAFILPPSSMRRFYWEAFLELRCACGVACV